mmetsp:Transcript_30226/g.67060  ORF Transcript_30226/g.67060 Transcript_30226/m.67060 type:complete len:95 (-) Transcript_30226:76-360(-)
MITTMKVSSDMMLHSRHITDLMRSSMPDNHHTHPQVREGEQSSESPGTLAMLSSCMEANNWHKHLPGVHRHSLPGQPHDDTLSAHKSTSEQLLV